MRPPISTYAARRAPPSAPTRFFYRPREICPCESRGSLECWNASGRALSRDGFRPECLLEVLVEVIRETFDDAISTCRAEPWRRVESSRSFFTGHMREATGATTWTAVTARASSYWSSPTTKIYLWRVLAPRDQPKRCRAKAKSARSARASSLMGLCAVANPK